ncbi:hypothetical protein TNCV_3631711 [Trichonephila clavipes]|nr:hypothetical protein TNCV_3631711 [Trichonephila clavipes]
MSLASPYLWESHKSHTRLRGFRWLQVPTADIACTHYKHFNIRHGYAMRIVFPVGSLLGQATSSISFQQAFVRQVVHRPSQARTLEELRSAVELAGQEYLRIPLNTSLTECLAVQRPVYLTVRATPNTE